MTESGFVLGCGCYYYSYYYYYTIVSASINKILVSTKAQECLSETHVLGVLLMFIWKTVLASKNF